MLANIFATIAVSTPLVLGAIAFATEKPMESPPAATASFDVRDAWCQEYAAWYVEQMPATPTPSDVRPTRRVETELQFCNLDPQEYQRLTVAELARTTGAG